MYQVTNVYAICAFAAIGMTHLITRMALERLPC